ncbi:MAG: addiction module toxin RelE [Alphaproteobacteria bacterium HGW-Alphaproteobacteria-15]|nr:MAG: addiction module toxin RelE [Alphaproteobacteria bacterium HGW-Alphaproteobacteria-15]
MVQVVWTQRALVRLRLIRAYIEQFDPDAAERLAARLIEAGDSLRAFPNRGRPAKSGRRELATVPPYVIRYRVEGQFVIIGDIKHGRQRH